VADAAAATRTYDVADFHAKNAIALEPLRTEFKGKVEVVQLPVPVLRDLRKLAAEVIREESEKTPMPGRCTPPSRSSRRSWVRGITWPRAPTISWSRGEVSD